MTRETGEIRAYLDDMTEPILTARDRTLGHGLVGVGSFDDTGAFDDLELRSDGPAPIPAKMDAGLGMTVLPMRSWHSMSLAEDD